ncbi:MAG: hypothetical protein KJ626_14320 [Verrucomicrobia bacterium]|nr:hypothetical protein [Verrucomicrobiota bacterium]
MRKLEKLTPEEELEYLKRIHGDDNSKLFSLMFECFSVLQNRAQMLLSLIIICLTITGFSGPKIAQSSSFSRLTLGYGLIFVLFSALILLMGPLQLRWGTRYRTGSIDDSLVALIRRRNSRTMKYYIAGLLLMIGFSGYVGSVIGYLFILEQ